MDSKKLIVLISAVFVVALVIVQFTRSHSDTPRASMAATDQGNNSENSNKDEAAATTNAGNAPASVAPPANAPAEPKEVTADDLNKVKVLKQILDSKNDNDPRLDTDFKNLSENAKKLMRAEYKSLQPEKFNEKGTVIFLLGRNLKSKEDFDFMADVLSEPPCLNLADCSAPAPPPSKGEAAHEDSISSVTLAYPQIVSLKALDNFLNSGQAAQERLRQESFSWAKHDIDVGTQSKDAAVAQMAQEIRHKSVL